MAAGRTNRVEVEIVATDEASPKIDRLEKKIDGLESDEARIIITAQTDRLERQIANAKADLEGLDGDEASVTARLVGNLEAELEQAQTLFNQLDGKTGTVRLNAIDKASKDLDQVATKMRQLDGETAKVRTTAGGIAGGVAGGIGLAALPGLISSAAQEASRLTIEVDTLAGLTGATVEDTSRLTGTFATADVEASDLADIMLNVNQVLRDDPELAAKLGVQIETNTDLMQTFVQAVDGVATSYDTAADRAAAATTLFGEEGVRQVGAVTRALDTDLATALEQFQGPIVDDESVDNAREIAAQSLKIKQEWQEISVMMLPIIAGTLEAVSSYFGAVNDAGVSFGEKFRNRPQLSGQELLGWLGFGDGGSPDIPRGSLTGGAPGAAGARVTVIATPGRPDVTTRQLDADQRRNGVR